MNGLKKEICFSTFSLDKGSKEKNVPQGQFVKLVFFLLSHKQLLNAYSQGKKNQSPLHIIVIKGQNARQFFFLLIATKHAFFSHRTLLQFIIFFLNFFVAVSPRYQCFCKSGLTADNWHLIADTLHLTPGTMCYRVSMGCGEHSLKVSGHQLFRFLSEGVLKILRKWMTESGNQSLTKGFQNNPSFTGSGNDALVAVLCEMDTQGVWAKLLHFPLTLQNKLVEEDISAIIVKCILRFE